MLCEIAAGVRGELFDRRIECVFYVHAGAKFDRRFNDRSRVRHIRACRCFIHHRHQPAHQAPDLLHALGRIAAHPGFFAGRDFVSDLHDRANIGFRHAFATQRRQKFRQDASGVFHQRLHRSAGLDGLVKHAV